MIVTPKTVVMFTARSHLGAHQIDVRVENAIKGAAFALGVEVKPQTEIRNGDHTAIVVDADTTSAQRFGDLIAIAATQEIWGKFPDGHPVLSATVLPT